MPIGFPAPPVTPIVPATVADLASATATTSAGGDTFAAMLSHGIENVQQLQHQADGLAVQAATGDLQDVHDYTLAATKAQLATELTVAIRNKAVEAFGEIMRMPV
jgi:flagellar hook-basal body complex protein FliE